jgi:hypothetical protein
MEHSAFKREEEEHVLRVKVYCEFFHKHLSRQHTAYNIQVEWSSSQIGVSYLHMFTTAPTFRARASHMIATSDWNGAEPMTRSSEMIEANGGSALVPKAM